MPDNYVLLRKTTLTANTASVTFSSIPQSGYTDLKVVYSARTSYSSNYSDPVVVTINGSTSTFSSLYASTNGSSVYSGTFNRWVGDAANSNVTANTFGNSEVYFPNYLSSNNKSFSFEGASENNGTLTDLAMGSGLWSTTSAIQTLQFTPLNGSFLANTEFFLYGIAAKGTTPTAGAFATGGDIITNDGTYWIHTFLSSGTFTPIKALSCDLLVVAGGAGGGGSDSSGRTAGGGGGAGGYLEQTSRSVAVGSYNVVIGAGGAQGLSGAAATPSLVTRGFNGSNSIFAAVTAIGGGGGQGGGGTGALNGSPNTGGSGGGGGAGNTVFYAGAAATQGNSDGATGFGFAGGTGVVGGTGGYQAGAGGGGAGGVGGNSLSSSTVSGGNGGIGGAGKQSSITGTATYYAAGGSGANEGSNASNTSTNSIGGAGGRGATSTNPTAGVANTGSGGGGGSYQGTGGTGGSGIVIIRYPIA